MAACRSEFTVVVAEDGEVRAFCRGGEGQLGLSTTEQQLLPARVRGREAFDVLIIMVVTGDLFFPTDK